LTWLEPYFIDSVNINGDQDRFGITQLFVRQCWGLYLKQKIRWGVALSFQ